MPSPIPRSTVIFLVVGMLAISQSANIIRLGHAPALVIVAWRVLIACAMLLPFVGRSLSELSSLSGRQRLLLLWIPHFGEPPPLDHVPVQAEGAKVQWDEPETAYVLQFRKPTGQVAPTA